VEAERTLLDALGGGCQVPIGAHCRPVREGDAIVGWTLHAQVVAPDGEQVVAVTGDVAKGVSASSLGLQCAEELKARGAMELLGETAQAG
jgi:hydroxymethylbilane synthase